MWTPWKSYLDILILFLKKLTKEFLFNAFFSSFFLWINPKANFLWCNLPKFYSFENFTVNFENLQTLQPKMKYL